AYLEGGASVFGIESTVVDLSDKDAHLLRPGIITQEAIESIIGPILGITSKSAIKAPGQMKKHYAPSIPVRLNASFVNADEALLAFGPMPLAGAGIVLNLSETEDLLQAASHLFSHLHALDNPRFQSIAVMPIPNKGVGVAINDRLRRASVRESED
ncbi:MAG: translation factor Sua5, partial [Alphaproteobacteria bacterium]|nr:translation factor Sua5 [Alphaproteobacteria bacterium]